MFRAPPSDMKSVCFMPLALIGWLIAVLLLAYSAFQIVSILYIEGSQSTENDDGSVEFGDWLSVGVHSLQIALTLMGMLCLTVRRHKGIVLLLSGFKLLYTTIVMQTITTWLAWVLTKTGIDSRQNMSRYEIFHIIITTVFGILLFGTSYWTYGALQSLVQVVEAGGTGWEFLNASQVKERCFQEFLIMSQRSSANQRFY
eukprot:Gregarina_sp_Pseudo_9__1911@NODE_2311_length_1046_cov_3_523337_g2128_i0_p1_GENE_NODE_2311_length_1046_cov_3_523337_g2128_i0NODE_2311_length_1046_cov_3_523337_g2128_i0_p1_ORF_typecomplete_len200_score44_47ABC2_membrane_2/PF12679_7/0_1MerC/PF03203_14/2_7DUF805/PF05656_14/80_NODE_2311_length_1046_cov_3_523337_g2128_i0188787